VTAPAGGSVTVDRTDNLFNETVHVSWQGFKPSSAPVVQQAVTTYVVRVYQCRGAAPVSPADCYGSSTYTWPGQTDANSHQPDGVPNFVDAATAANGTGSVDIEVRTRLEASTLGCDKDHPCSIVVVPNYGDGNKKNDFTYATNAYMDSAWAWANHVTVPITLAPTGDYCPLGDVGVGLVGAPGAKRAIMSWQPVACQPSTGGVKIGYTALGELQGRAGFLSGLADVGLTTLPADRPGTRSFTYAPIATDAIAVAFHIDEDAFSGTPTAGLPITDMKLNARLVAKLITESYGGVGYTAPGTPLGNGNPAVVGNPQAIYTDPEFLALNPGHAWPVSTTNPLVVSGNQDLTWELTRWIDSDRVARAWLDGAPDQWGMKVNTNFKGIDYPASAIELRDPYLPLTYTFVPIDGLDLVARGLVSNQPSSYNPTPVPPLNTHPKDPQQLPGRRALIAIVDSASAAAFNFPTASLLNAGGSYVGPTNDSMSATLSGMKANPDGVTHYADFSNSDPAAYPLTLVHYAMVPTSGTLPDKVTQIVRFLDYAGGPGQVPGLEPGKLPPGYLPLTPALRSQEAAAATAVRTQSGTKPKPASSPAAQGGSASGGPGSLGGVVTPAPASSFSGGSPNSNGSSTGTAARTAGSGPGPGHGATPVVAASPNPVPAGELAFRSTPAQSGGFVRLVLPFVLAAGLIAALLGPALILIGRGGLAGRWAAPFRRRRPSG